MTAIRDSSVNRISIIINALIRDKSLLFVIIRIAAKDWLKNQI